MTWLNVIDEDSVFLCLLPTAHSSPSSVHPHITHSSSFISLHFKFHLSPHSPPLTPLLPLLRLGENKFLFAFFGNPPPHFFECSWLCTALTKLLGFYALSLNPAPLTGGQLCRHKLPTKAACRWPWRPPEGTVRTSKWGSVFAECLRQ